jgi:hypothetical protein
MLQHGPAGWPGPSQTIAGDDTLTMGLNKFGPKKGENINNEECN